MTAAIQKARLAGKPKNAQGRENAQDRENPRGLALTKNEKTQEKFTLRKSNIIDENTQMTWIS